ncbi:hypothetical protein GCM10012288_07640 [Malaciobacter pacificus]|uniref:Lcl C-terminal domain-containing protein n=1 Tax=Malaciobacter pacificus TaxID=1080223 RepID=UPI00147760D5|nr:DUF1566 domain-containing protein [Malaciobacter pacificus]GGD36130.1 hypothetical protein GCM10012288_07640 [Malaciobacter pacificus]
MFRNLLFIFISIFILSGCGGGTSSSSTVKDINTQVITGKVADGYIVGANVCLDLNQNEICDENEPKTKSVNGGQYTLNIDKNIDISKYSFIVEVPVGAIDEDDNLPIQKPYILSAPKGETAFISPVSTLIKSIQTDENLTLEQAKEKYKLQVGINDSSLDILDNYIDSPNLSDLEKTKIHNIAKITVKLMAENQEPILSSLADSGLKDDITHQKSLQTINNHIINQLPAISDIDEVTNESLQALQPKINLDTLYTDLELTQNQQVAFAGSLVNNVKNDNEEVKTDICTEEVLGNGMSLSGLTYCIDIVDGKEISKFFTVSEEEQDTLIYVKNLKGEIEFSLYKKEADNYNKVSLPFFRSTKDGKLYIFGDSNISFRLDSGQYKIVFSENNWLSKDSNAEVNIIGEITDKVYVNGIIDSKVNVNPYNLSDTSTKTINGTLHSVFDYNNKDKLIDIIPIKSADKTIQAIFSLDESEFNVQIVNASYFSKILFPTMVLEKDGILFDGKASELKNEKFILTKQPDKDDSYFVIISTPFTNKYSTYYLNNIFSKYKLTVQTSSLPDATLSVGGKTYKASINTSTVSEVISNNIKIKDSLGIVVEYDEFSTSIDKAKQLTSSLQTLHSVLNFDEGSMMRFYDNYVKTINAIDSAQNSMFITEALTSIAINAYTFDGLGLTSDFYTGVEELFNQNNQYTVKALGINFLQYGYEILRDYSVRKRNLITEYFKSEVILTNNTLESNMLSELSKLFILQNRASAFMQYGMQIYQATTDLEERTFLEYLRDRLISVGISVFPDSILKSTAGILSISASHLENISDIYSDSVYSINKKNEYKKIWEELFNLEKYPSFYTDSVQLNNIEQLKNSGYTFEEEIPEETNTITHNGFSYGKVISPTTGRVWLDRNIGANRVCTSATDELCFGDYFQWGRNADGHEKLNSTTSINISNSILPNNSNFILDNDDESDDGAYFDWTNVDDSNSSQRTENWSKLDGTSVCPIGFRVPNYNELLKEPSFYMDFYSGFLKLPNSGYRDGTTGLITTQNIEIWSSTANPYGGSYYMGYVNSSTNIRVSGLPIRCIKDDSTVVSTSSSFSLAKLSTGQTASYSNFDDGYYKKGTARNYTKEKGIVIDKVTGLQWQDDYSDNAGAITLKPWSTQTNYDAANYDDTIGDTAVTYCENLTLGDYNDWRLPTQEELESIIDYSKYSPSMNSVFENTISDSYWSSTSSAKLSSQAWGVYFNNGWNFYAFKNANAYVRCVR